MWQAPDIQLEGPVQMSYTLPDNHFKIGSIELPVFHITNFDKYYDIPFQFEPLVWTGFISKSGKCTFYWPWIAPLNFYPAWYEEMYRIRVFSTEATLSYGAHFSIFPLHKKP